MRNFEEYRILYPGSEDVNTFENSLVTTEYVNLMSEHDFLSGIHKPTREENCVDHIFIRERNECNTINQAMLSNTSSKTFIGCINPNKLKRLVRLTSINC